MSGPSSDWVQQLLVGLAKGAADAATGYIGLLLKSFGSGTEPDFHSIVLTYDTMLAIALLLAGSVIALAVIEHVLGGNAGAGFAVIGRTLAATALASAGLYIVQYFTGFAAALASVWNLHYLAQSAALQHQVASLYSMQLPTRTAAGAAALMLLVAGLTLLIAIVVYIELIVRSALILVTTVFLPFVVVLAIWPRLTGGALHLVEFLGVLLLSKFFIATAIYVGFSLIAANDTGPSSFTSGLAILFMAAVAPVALFRGLRFTNAGGAIVARGWTSRGARTGLVVGGLAVAGARWGVGELRPRLAPLWTRAAASVPQAAKRWRG